ncbi:GTPase HflX [Clostridiaceae bacterium Marseille-Q4145]|nr:GTPase HflX [Clostridiaceae bacterium Marseille-Q4145]
MREEPREQALLLGVKLRDGEDFERSMEELWNLAEACGMQVTGQITQNMERPHSALYMGKGKLLEVKEFLEKHLVDVVIFDRQLSPSQLRNLEQLLDCAILDRTSLILEIFAVRARTREARLQVESARLQYILPRLTGMHKALSRQGGGSGISNKGAGEKKLELDRRRIEKRMSELRRELEQVSKEREIQRSRRQGSGIPRVALVGYTNAGKSTLMNSMLDKYSRDPSKRVMEKNMLFATLDTTVRRIHTGPQKEFLLSDTVGFIHQLPTGLIKAFRSTLEEAREADLLLHVLDYSDEACRQQREVTEETLKELGAGDIPVIYVYNKSDLRMQEDGSKMTLPRIQENRIYLSAKTGEGIQELVDMIWKLCGENKG